MREKKTKISGWGNYPTCFSQVARPERCREVRVGEGVKTIARGLGRSYGDAALNTDHQVVLFERLNRFLSFDAEKGVLRAEAGASLEEILEMCVPRGWFLPVTPGTKYVTLGGCFAADLHGKNHHRDGTFCKHVLEIELMTPDGVRIICSPSQNSDYFWATAGGMGLTGFITEVTVQLIPISTAYMKVTHRIANGLDSVLDLLSDPSMDDRYSVAWIDCLATGKSFGRSVLMTGHHAEPDELRRRYEKKDPLAYEAKHMFSVPFYFPSWTLNPWTVKAFNELFYFFQCKKTKPYLTDINHYFYPLDAVNGWNRFYGRTGFIQYQFVLPTQEAREGMHVLLQRFVSSRRGSFLAVIKKFGSENLGYLSFPKEGFTLALDIPISDPALFPFLDEMDELVLKYGGRIYLAKDARMKPETFRLMYPRFTDWLKIKQKLDSNDSFSSDLSRRLHMGCFT